MLAEVAVLLNQRFGLSAPSFHALCGFLLAAANSISPKWFVLLAFVSSAALAAKATAFVSSSSALTGWSYAITSEKNAQFSQATCFYVLLDLQRCDAIYPKTSGFAEV